MSEREDVEALADEVGFGTANAGMVLRSSWLAAHVEAVRVSERVRLAGEVEALAVEMGHDECECESYWAGRLRSVVAALVPVPGVRLTEEE